MYLLYYRKKDVNSKLTKKHVKLELTNNKLLAAADINFSLRSFDKSVLRSFTIVYKYSFESSKTQPPLTLTITFNTSIYNLGLIYCDYVQIITAQEYKKVKRKMGDEVSAKC